MKMKIKGRNNLNLNTKCCGYSMLLSLTLFSLFTIFLLSTYTLTHNKTTTTSYDNYSHSHSHSHSSIFAFKGKHKSSNRLWGPLKDLLSLSPFAFPRLPYASPSVESTGFIYVRIKGGFHEIRSAICDVVVVARLLNATLVIPEILSTTTTKGISLDFKSFAYLYDQDHFIAALAKDVNIVKTLPKNLKYARRKKAVPLYNLANSQSPYFYLNQVLPVLRKHMLVELLVSNGECLQQNLPLHLEEFQRLRCRVAFHALRFRHHIHDLANNILNRIKATGRPFIAYETGMTKDALAFYGCADLFQDVHTELIQHRRSWMLKRGIVKGKLSVDSAQQRLNGSCPLMPEEVGLILRANGYHSNTIIYVSGGEIFGGQRILIPLHAMFDNVVDRTSLSTTWELTEIYGRETMVADSPPRAPPSFVEERKLKTWKNTGPRPRPLPPPPARPKYPYNIEGWWGWVAESDNEPESTLIERRINAHKLLWEAIDYVVCTEADAFISGFDRDGKGRPNFASLVMGHRLYLSAASVTYRPERKEVVRLIDEVRESVHPANRTWLSSVRRHMKRATLDGLVEAMNQTKPMSFLSHPVPECACLRKPADTSPSTDFDPRVILRVEQNCPAWMGRKSNLKQKEKEIDEEIYVDDGLLSALLFGRSVEKENSNGGKMNQEEPHLEDQEEVEGGER